MQRYIAACTRARACANLWLGHLQSSTSLLLIFTKIQRGYLCIFFLKRNARLDDAHVFYMLLSHLCLLCEWMDSVPYIFFDFLRSSAQLKRLNPTAVSYSYPTIHISLHFTHCSAVSSSVAVILHSSFVHCEIQMSKDRQYMYKYEPPAYCGTRNRKKLRHFVTFRKKILWWFSFRLSGADSLHFLLKMASR